MKAISLADISYQDALELLMMRKEALDSGKEQPLPKEVRDVSLFVKAANNYFDQAKTWLSDKANSAATGYQDFTKNNPNISSALNYGLIGAGVAGAGSLAHSAGTKDKNWKRKALRNALLGGGAGLAANVVVNSPRIADTITDKLAPKAVPGAPKPVTPPAGNGLLDKIYSYFFSAAKPDSKTNTSTPADPAATQKELVGKAYSYTPEATLAAHAGAAAVPAYYLHRMAKAPGLDRSMLTEQLRADATKALASNAANPVAELTKKYNPMELNKLMGQSTNQATNPDLLKNLFKPVTPSSSNPLANMVPGGNQVIDHEDLYRMISKSPALQGKDAKTLATSLMQSGDDATNLAGKIVSPGLLETKPNGGYNWSLKGVKPGKRLAAGSASAILASLLLSGAASYRNNAAARAAAKSQLGNTQPLNVRDHMNALTGGIFE